MGGFFAAAYFSQNDTQQIHTANKIVIFFNDSQHENEIE